MTQRMLSLLLFLCAPGLFGAPIVEEAADTKKLPQVAGLPLLSEKTPFWFDVEGYRRNDLRKLPIGVFDSGVGGLTVLAGVADSLKLF